MNIIIERFNKIKSNISKINNSSDMKIIAISKTFPLEHIMPLIELGHNHFGENLGTPHNEIIVKIMTLPETRITPYGPLGHRGYYSISRLVKTFQKRFYWQNIKKQGNKSILKIWGPK